MGLEHQAIHLRSWPLLTAFGYLRNFLTVGGGYLRFFLLFNCSARTTGVAGQHSFKPSLVRACSRRACPRVTHAWLGHAKTDTADAPLALQLPVTPAPTRIRSVLRDEDTQLSQMGGLITPDEITIVSVSPYRWHTGRGLAFEPAKSAPLRKARHCEKRARTKRQVRHVVHAVRVGRILVLSSPPPHSVADRWVVRTSQFCVAFCARRWCQMRALPAALFFFFKTKKAAQKARGDESSSSQQSGRGSLFAWGVCQPGQSGFVANDIPKFAREAAVALESRLEL